jgi:hypothetical protein
MHTPFLDDVVRLRMNELEADARRARQRRELAGPSVIERLRAKWRRPTISPESGRHTRPVPVARTS